MYSHFSRIRFIALYAFIALVYTAVPAVAQDLQVFFGSDAEWNTLPGDSGSNDPGMGGIYYYDADTSNGWTPGDDAWIEVIANGKFDYGTEVSFFMSLTGGEIGSQNGLFYTDNDPADGKYTPTEEIWFDVDGNGHYDTAAVAGPPSTGIFVAWWGATGDGTIGMPYRTLSEAMGGQLNPGDTIRVATSYSTDYLMLQDSQYYKLTAPMFIPYGVVVLGGYRHDFTKRDPDVWTTVIDAQNASPAIMIEQPSVTVDGFRFIRGQSYCMGGSTIDNVVITNNQFTGSSGTAVDLPMGMDLTVRNNVFAYNRKGLYVMATPILVVNNTFAYNDTGLIVGSNSGVTVKNNIFAYHAVMAMFEDGTFAETLAYNSFFGNTQDCENFPMGVMTTADLNTRSGNGANNMLDPVFINPDQIVLDFHLQPESQCIDAGDPAMPYYMEPQPNGGLINLGAYGNTPYAALSGGGNQTGAPFIEPYGGQYSDPLTVTITTYDSGAVIFYTIDAGDPDTASPVYTGPLSLSEGYHEVRAFAVAPGKSPSMMVMQTYDVISGPVPAPYVADSTTLALWHFDEQSGSIAYDASGNNLNLVLTAPTAWSYPGFFDGGLDLSQGDMLFFDDTTGVLAPDNSVTIDFRMRSSYLSGTLLQYGLDVQYISIVAGSGMRFQVSDGTSSQGVDVYSLDDDLWHQVKFVIDFGSDTLAVFVDDALQGAADISMISPVAVTDQPLQIGSAMSLYLDELRFTRGARYKEPLPAPSMPSGFSEGVVTEYLVPLSWDLNPAYENVIAYVLYRDGTLIDSMPGTVNWFNDDSVYPNSYYNYELEAVNSEGLRSYRTGLWVGTPGGQTVETWTTFSRMNGDFAYDSVGVIGAYGDEIWAAQAGNTFRFNEWGGGWYNEGELGDYQMRGFAPGRMGEFWAAGDGNLIRYDPADTVNAFSYFTPQPQAPVIGISVAENGDVWVATADGGAGRFSVAGDSFTVYTSDNGLASNSLLSVAAAPTGGETWFGHAGSGISIYNGTDWRYVARTEGLADMYVTALAPMPAGMWAGTRSTGVFAVDGSSGTVSDTINSADGLLSERITCLYTDTYGVLWIGTEVGIMMYDGTDNPVLTNDDGLVGNFITGITEGSDGAMWFATSRGVSRYRVPRPQPVGMGISGRVFDARDSSLINPNAYTVRLVNTGSAWNTFGSYPDGMQEGYVVNVYDYGTFMAELSFNDSELMGQWWDSTFTFSSDEHYAGIDFYAQPGDSIKGKVTYTMGSAENVVVIALPAGKQPDPNRVRNREYPHAQTDMYGAYRIRGLAPGGYRVLASDMDQTNSVVPADQYYNGKQRFTAADSIVLDGAALHTRVDFNLTPGATVAGTLFSVLTGLPVAGEVYIVTGTGVPVKMTSADNSSGYRISGIPAGTYTVYAEPWNDNDERMLPGYYGGAENLSAAALFTVAAESVYEGRNISFRTDDVLPEIIALAPGADTLAAVTAAVTVRFSERMDTESVEREFRFKRLTGGIDGDGEDIPGTPVWNGDSILTFVPDAVLLNAAVYGFEVRGSDLAGNGMEQSRRGVFVTAAAAGADSAVPQVAAVGPAPGASWSLSPFFMGITFSEVMDPAGLTDAVSFSGGAVISEYIPEMNLVLLRPVNRLTAGNTYTVTVNGAIRDAAGNAMGVPYVWSFTAATVDTDPPEVLYTLPNDKQSGVPFTDRVSIVFDELIDLSAIDTASISVVRTSAGTTTLTWKLRTESHDGMLQAGERLELITDKADFEEGATYTVTLGDGAVRDLAGNPLPAYTFSYTLFTGMYNPVIAVHHSEAGASAEQDSLKLDIQLEFDLYNNAEWVGGPIVGSATVRDLTGGGAALQMDVDEYNGKCRLQRKLPLAQFSPGYHRLECVVNEAQGGKTVVYERIYVFNPLPQVLAPVDSIETSTRPAFQWQEVPGAAWYALMIDDGDEYTPPEQFLLYPQGGDTARFTLPANRELPEGTYRWAVMAGSDIGDGAGMGASDFGVFRAVVQTGPVQPAAVKGLTAVQQKTDVKVTWQPSPLFEQVGTYGIARSSDGGSVFEPLDTVTTASYLDTGAVFGATYYYRVYALNAYGAGLPATTGPVTVTHGPPVSIAVTLAPNPVPKNTPTVITATAADKDGNVWDVSGSSELKLFSVFNGDTVMLDTTVLVPAQEGTYVIIADLKGLAGTRNLRVTIGTLTQLRLSPSTPVILQDSTLVLTAMGTYSTGDVLDVTGAVTWQTTDTDGRVDKGVYVPGGPGTFSIRVTGAGGLSENVTVTVKKNMPPVITLHTTFKDGGVTHSSMFAFRATASDTDLGTITSVEEVQYLLSGPGQDAVWQTTAAGSWMTYPAQLDTGTYLLRIKAEDAKRHAGSVQARMTVETRRFPVPEEQWRMVSVPHKGTERSAAALFNFPSAVYRWNEDLESDRFLLKYEDMGADTVAPGDAVWIRADGKSGIDRTGDPYYGTGDSVAFSLKRGWNQIGNPFGYPIKWFGELFYPAVHGTDAVTGNLPVVEPRVWRYDGTGYADTDPDLLQPWEGYFVKANVPCVAVLSNPQPYFGAVTDGPQQSIAKGAAGTVADADWGLNISAVSGAHSDGYAVLGNRAGALSGQDRFDISEPLAAPDGGISAYLVNPDVPYNLAADIRPAGDDGAWVLGVDAAGGAPVRLSWTPAAVAGDAYLIDEKRGVSVDMAQEGAYAYKADSDGSDRFSVVRGTDAAQLAGMAGAGIFIYNTPNPFRAGTVISYRIPADAVGAAAYLEVFNTDGTRTLNRRVPATAGSFNTFIWDAAGPAGIYYYRISTGTGWSSQGRMLRAE